MFTPGPEEVDRARRLVDQYDEALAGGRGVVLDEDGRMVDEAVVRQSRRLLMLADLNHPRRGEEGR